MINCSICNSEIEEENGDIVGYFGDMEVSFCIWCLSCLINMMIKIDGRFIVVEGNEYSKCCNYPALYKIIDNVVDRWDFCGDCLNPADFCDRVEK